MKAISNTFIISLFLMFTIPAFASVPYDTVTIKNNQVANNVTFSSNPRKEPVYHCVVTQNGPIGQQAVSEGDSLLIRSHYSENCSGIAFTVMQGSNRCDYEINQDNGQLEPQGSLCPSITISGSPDNYTLSVTN